MIIGQTSIPVVKIKYKGENDFHKFENNFSSDHSKNNAILKNQKFKDIFDEESDMFFCDTNNQINDIDCCKNNELCKNCQLLNQAYHKLKKNYLINSAGRVCTYRKGKMFCLGKFQKVYKEEFKVGKEAKKGNINYLENLICNGKIQCAPCKRMQENMQKYYAQDLYKAIILRDEKLGY